MDHSPSHPICGSPLGVVLLMKAHYSGAPIGNGSPADESYISHLVAHGMIEGIPGETNCYRTTEKGAFHVIALCRLPFPVASWETPDARG